MPVPDGALTTNAETQRVSIIAKGLAAGTTYHYRVIAHNDAGSFTGGDNEFTTFAPPPPGYDSCANAHVRQQTGAAFLRDCRAYELVSAEDTGGYNVESDLVPGQTPFGGYPRAGERVLYGVHNGAIPGPWNPTNRGVDPYVATRGEDGWKTEYVGIPADLPSGTGGPFASPLAGADEGLDSFAFAGEGICEPCFEDGSVNVPLRMPDGELIKGMAGSLEPSAGPGGKDRQALLRRRLALPLRLDREIRGRRQLERHRHDDLRARSRRRHDPGRLEASEREHDRQRRRASRRWTSPTTAPGS